VTAFALLAPDLTPSHLKLLRAAASHPAVMLHLPDTIARDLSTAPTHVLSVGKSALDVWHDFGLVQVGVNHGDVFTHRSPTTGRTHKIMVVEHPGNMAQTRMEFGAGKVLTAREDMVRDLGRWGFVLRGKGTFHPDVCGGCLKSTKSKLHRSAVYWLDELDGVGLCEDHYRARANYRRKRVVVPVKDRGKTEHQIPGQMEMLPGDGTKVMVAKR
jgi:hypothetical protein